MWSSLCPSIGLHSQCTVIVIHNAAVQAFSSGVVATPLIYGTVRMHAYPANSSDSAAEASGVETSAPLLLQHQSLRGLQIWASQGPGSDIQVLQHSGSQMSMLRFKSLSARSQGRHKWCFKHMMYTLASRSSSPDRNKLISSFWQWSHYEGTFKKEVDYHRENRITGTCR